MEIKVQVEGDKIKSVSKNDTAAGNLNSYICSFSFDEAWESLIRVAVFIRNDTYYNVPLIENTCAVPYDILNSPGSAYIGIFGFDKEEDTSVRISAVPRELTVLRGSFSAKAAEPKEGELAIWEQYVLAAETARDEAQQAAQAAVDSESNIKNTIETELKAAKESGMFDGADGQDGAPGQDGKDGVSCTHEWDGTVLKVTSASGTSEADLKGDKGDKGDTGEKGDKGDTGAQGPQGEKGDKGADGKNGADGYTPVRGVDYWTKEDIAEIKTYVDEAVEELIPDAVTDPSGALILTNNTQVETSATVGAVSTDNYGIYIGSILEDPVPDIFESVWHILPCEEPFIVGIGSGMTILFFGDDCSEAGEFTPQANTHYEISFKRLGTDDSGNPLIIARVGAWQ